MRWSTLVSSVLFDIAIVLFGIGGGMVLVEGAASEDYLPVFGASGAVFVIAVGAWMTAERQERSTSSLAASPVPVQAEPEYRRNRAERRTQKDIGADMQRTIDGLTALLRNRSQMAPGPRATAQRLKARFRAWSRADDEIVGLSGRVVHGSPRWQRETMVMYGQTYREALLDYFYEAVDAGLAPWEGRKAIHVASTVPQLWGMIDQLGQLTMQLMGHTDGS